VIGGIHLGPIEGYEMTATVNWFSAPAERFWKLKRRHPPPHDSASRYSRPGEFNVTEGDAIFNSDRYKISKTCETISLPNSLVSLIVSNAKPAITMACNK
jgi:hypothetical protein